jgi:nucleotide-binding universal stress UspA family protein
MKKILITLDFDPTARKVAQAGYELARGIGAEIYLLHVTVDDTYYSSLEYSPITGFTGYNEATFSQMVNADELSNAAQYFLDNFKKYLGDESIRTIVEKGETAEGILTTAARIGANIIVMGTHSRRWLDQVLMGSVSEEILHRSSIPLFIVPTKKVDTVK